MANTPNKKTPPAHKLHEITMQELREMWPNSPDGKLCARLLQRYGFTVLIQISADAEAGPMTSQAEAGANKLAARMVRDFGGLAEPPSEVAARKPMAPLHRFSPEKPNQEKPEKP